MGEKMIEGDGSKGVLQQEPNNLKKILDAMPEGIYIGTQKNEIQYINPVMERDFGPVQGRKCHQYLHDLSEVCSWCRNREVFAGRSIRWEWHFFKTGKTYELFSTPILNGDGTIGKLEIFHDISERKEVEKALRESERQLRYLSSQLLIAQERERRRISRKLHDELGQALALIKLSLKSIQKNLGQDQGQIKEGCERTLAYVNEAIENARRLSRDLSPSILEDLGLPAALRCLIDHLSKNYNISVSSEIGEIDHRFAPEDQINIYRIFQEALNNVGKHAQARNVSVEIKNGGERISFSVEDDGKGFDVQKAQRRKGIEGGLGLAIMKERVQMLGGALDLRSREGQGTRIAFDIPIVKKGGV